jgi:peptidoglycan/LPS O-acetylase OafA/YrhL
MNEKVNWEILSLTRFLLALIVMIGHLQEFSSLAFLKWYTYLGSFEAILGFLLISGLSIGKSISKNRNNYFKRRIQRIYPVYFVSIIFQIYFFLIRYLQTNLLSARPGHLLQKYGFTVWRRHF